MPRTLLDTSYAADAYDCGMDGPTDPDVGGYRLELEAGAIPSVTLSSMGQEIEIVGLAAIRAVFGNDSYVTRKATQAVPVSARAAA